MDVEKASATVQARVELQKQELSRQLKVLAQLEKNIKTVKLAGSPIGTLSKRIDAMIVKHKQLEEQLNRCLQILIDNHAPQLSEAEKEWFGELKRMKAEVSGEPSRSLKARTELLTSHLELLRPKLIALSQGTGESTRRRPLQDRLFGQSQLQGVQELLSQEDAELKDAKRKVELLKRQNQRD